LCRLWDKVITLVVFLCVKNRFEMKYELQKASFVLVILLAFIGCREGSTSMETLTKVNPRVETDFLRAEQLLQEGNLEALRQASPDFYNLYFGQILSIPDNSTFDQVNAEITQDTAYLNLYAEVQKQFPNLTRVEAEVNQALENYATLFELPDASIPDIYTFISGFIYQTFVFQDGRKEGIGVSLEMFLGNEFSYKSAMPKNPLFSDYLSRAYNQDHLAKKIIEVLIEDKLPPPNQGNFLSLIIWGGKKLYLMDQILTFAPDTVITEYTPAQLNWCHHNQVEMWDYFFERDLFYSTDYRSFNKLIAPAPTSPGMPKESPGATGNYMGWQIVRSYMRRHPETTAMDLLLLQDAQQILDDSKYKPI